MRGHLFLLRHPDSLSEGRETVGITSFGRYEYIPVAGKILYYAESKPIHVLSSPAERAMQGSQLLVYYIGGKIEPIPLLWTTKDRQRYQYRTGDTALIAKDEQLWRTDFRDPEHSRIFKEIRDALTTKVRQYIADSGLLPKIEGVEMPYDSMGWNSSKRRGEQTGELEESVDLAFRPKTSGPYLNALIKERLADSQVLVVVSHAELFDYGYLKSLFSSLGIPSENFASQIGKMDFKKHHGLHAKMEDSNPNSRYIELISKQK